MTNRHKIGIHVTSSHRKNYDLVAPHIVAVTATEAGAFDEVGDKCIKIWRTQTVPQHEDAPEDFDTRNEADLPAMGEWWWENYLRDVFKPVREEYGENTYFQPTNEINNPRIVKYLSGMLAPATRDGFKLALFGDGPSSPDWDDWVKYWVPLLREAQDGGHIYARHVYTGLPSDQEKIQTTLTNIAGQPADSNAFRPFHEASYLRNRGIHTPMVISELGWLGGRQKLPHGWLADLMKYNQLMLEHENIIGGTVWNAGEWEGLDNILDGQPLKEIGQTLQGLQPVYFSPARVRSKINATTAVVDAPKKPSSHKGNKTFDLLSYMRGSHGKQYIVKTRTGDQAGSQERYRYEVDQADKHWYIVKNHQWEKYHWDGKWIYSDMDTSPGNGRFYVVRKTKGGKKLAERCPRFMKVGQRWVGATHWVQFYMKDGIVPSDQNSGEASNTAEFVTAGTWISPDGQVYEDTITLNLGGEIQIYQKGGGRIAWESNWGSSSITPENVNHQQPMGREKIGFLGE